MTKVCILGDTHFGVRGDSNVFHDRFEKFYSEILFPYLDKNGIDTIFQLGDMFDKKKNVNFYTLDRCKKYFFDEAKKRDIKIVCNVGNHDIYYKGSCQISAPALLLPEYDNVVIIDKPLEYEIEHEKFLILPWICNENESEVRSIIKSTKAQICLGHLALSGFCMYKGLPAEGGMPASIFDKFDMVLTGHYHHRSSDGSIFYVGTPYELTWSDFDDPRGFHILDLNDRDLTFIENPFTMFHKIEYDDTKCSAEELLNIDTSVFKDTYVKIVVASKSSEMTFDAFVKHVEEGGAVDVKITENPIELLISTEEIEDVEDTMTIIMKSIDDLESTISTPRLKEVMVELYNEASRMESA
jgi:DNA repair exonuclease SbcCD nuclease subunit